MNIRACGTTFLQYTKHFYLAFIQMLLKIFKLLLTNGMNSPE